MSCAHQSLEKNQIVRRSVASLDCPDRANALGKKGSDDDQTSCTLHRTLGSHHCSDGTGACHRRHVDSHRSREGAARRDARSDYGPNPHGLVIFTTDGYYSVQIYRAERVKFSSGDKFKGTPEEYRDASLSMSVHFGRYSVDPIKHTITFSVDRSSVPNVDDTTAVRPYELKGDELSWRVAARPDGSIPTTTLRRAR